MKVNGQYQYGGLVGTSTSDPNFGKCTNCGGELDYRDLYRNTLCAKCRREQDKITRITFLGTLSKGLTLEERVARLEALLYDHETNHPSKQLAW